MEDKERKRVKQIQREKEKIMKYKRTKQGNEREKFIERKKERKKKDRGRSR